MAIHKTLPTGRSINALSLVAKAGMDEAERLSREVADWLRAHGAAARCFLSPADTLPESLGDERDLILVFGGDGTMVSVGRRTLGLGIPLAGVNFGKVGFLTELSPAAWQSPLEHALRHGVRVEPRMTLRWRHVRGGVCLRQGEVVNDVTLTRGKVARLIPLELGINRKSFVALRSDGLVLSTPTGSSGYAGSAGGPLLHPAVNAYIVVPICPYLCGFHPLVLRPECVVSVRVLDASTDVILTLDGQEAHAMRDDDRLEAWGEPARFLMADFGRNSYFDRLKQVGFVQEYKAPS
jgi:NAD+ kinase